MKIFDTHAHYFDARFHDYPNGANALLREICPTPVAYVVNVGTNIKNSKKAIAQAKEFDFMYASVGIHPEDAHYIADKESTLQELEDMLSPAFCKENKVVALGEIGLDYHFPMYGDIPLSKELEMEYFDAQMRLAEKYDIPVIIHDREAHGDCFEMVLRYPKVRGVFHSYSGSPEMAMELTRRGWFISFSGTVTFKNAYKVKECARVVPEEFLLVETDAPYLAPHPLRGTMNRSDNIRYTIEAIAEERGMDAEKLAEVLMRNSKRFFGIE